MAFFLFKELPNGESDVIVAAFSISRFSGKT